MREAIFAGSFYPGGKAEIEGFIKGELANASVDAKAVHDASAFVAPHAGYVYPGRTSAHTYRALSLSKAADADTIVIIGPNHTGLGMSVAVSTEDWKTPLGVVRNDRGLSEAIIKASEGVAAEDETAHLEEHSIEVQLPFIQYSLPGKKACMICMGNQSESAAAALEGAISAAANELGRSVAVIASSDFDHYEPVNTANWKDNELFEALGTLDTKEFNRRLRTNGCTVCGYGPITVAALFAKRNGAKRGLLLNYSNSGETAHDFTNVVTYASMAFV